VTWDRRESWEPRNELKAPFGEVVVTGRRQMAARADRDRTLARSYGHFDAFPVGAEVRVLVDEPLEAMAGVQDGDQFHGAESSGCEVSKVNRFAAGLVRIPKRSSEGCRFERAREASGKTARRVTLGSRVRGRDTKPHLGPQRCFSRWVGWPGSILGRSFHVINHQDFHLVLRRL